MTIATQITTKRTDQLERGDRVCLPNAAIRTVSHITDAGYLNRDNKPIRVVHYVEPADEGFGRGDWCSTGNTACDASEWKVLETVETVSGV